MNARVTGSGEGERKNSSEILSTLKTVWIAKHSHITSLYDFVKEQAAKKREHKDSNCKHTLCFPQVQ